MPQAIGDPEELRNFANMLAQYLETLETETNNLQNGFSNLSETWQDEKRAAFEEQFGALMAQIAQFKAASEEQVPYLLALAEKLQNYLNS